MKCQACNLTRLRLYARGKRLLGASFVDIRTGLQERVPSNWLVQIRFQGNTKTIHIANTQGVHVILRETLK